MLEVIVIFFFDVVRKLVCDSCKHRDIALLLGNTFVLPFFPLRKEKNSSLFYVGKEHLLQLLASTKAFNGKRFDNLLTK